MKNLLTAFARALASLSQAGILWHLIWPGLLAGAFWLVLASWYWSDMLAWTLEAGRSLPLVGPWLGQSGFAVAGALLLHFVQAALLLPLIFVTALVLFGLFAFPLMLARLAEGEYGDLERRHGGSLFGSVVNTLLAALVFTALFVLTLPLWLIPGLALLLPWLLSAWLNQRVYRFDALMEHASVEEFADLQRACRGGLFVIGLVAGMLAWLPLANLLAAPFAGLASVHYCLEALRRRRRGVA